MASLEYVGYDVTPWPGEMTDKIWIKTTADKGWTPILQIVRDVLPGDILDINAGAQATNNLNKAPWNTTQHNVGLGQCLAFIHPVTLAFTPITYWRGRNLDARLHHGPRDDSAIWRVPEGVQGPTAIRFYMKSAALQAKSSWYLRVDQGYGQMSIKHERPVA